MLARLLAIALFVSAPAISFAQTLADRLPSDTVVYVGWSGTTAMGDEYAASHLKAVLDASNIPEVFVEFLPKALAAMTREEPGAKELADMIDVGYRVYRHPFAYAFTGVDWKKDTPRLIGLCDGGADADKIFKTAAAQFDETGFARHGEKLPFPVRVGREGSLIIWAMGYEKAEAAIIAKGAAARALSGTANYKAALAQLGKKPVLVGFADVELGIKLIDRALIEERESPQQIAKWTKAQGALGLPGVKSISFASGFDQKDWSTQAFIDAPSPRKGLLTMLESKPLTDDALRAIPVDAISAGVFRFDPSGLMKSVREIVGDLDANGAAQMEDGLAQINQMLAMDVEKDFLGSLGDEWAYYASPSVGGEGLMGMAFINRLKNPAKAAEAIAKLQEFTNSMIEQNSPDPKVKVRIKQTKVGDLTINYLAVPFVTPSWAIQDGRLYVGMYPQIVASAVRYGSGAGKAAVGGDKAKSILDNPKFVAMRARLGTKTVSSIQFSDLAATAPQTYTSWLGLSRLVGFGDIFGIDSPPMVLPELGALMSHLAPAGAAAWSDTAGWHFRSVSPFPGSAALASDPLSNMGVGQSALVASIMLPALNRTREQGNRIKSASNLKQIGLGVVLYANDHKGKFPPNLGVLITEEDLTFDVFINPRTNTQAPHAADPAALAAWVNESSDYAYVGAGLKITAGPDVVVAYEKPGALKDGINILFADGHVEFFDMERGMQLIAPPAKGERIDGGI